ncbi:hypothetical protein L228DRAFT_258070 [Xylona heveae TC161]|uniref:DUF1308 domain-containing protein n=1 Tax=Xylona heveae (strain CBS 132557 / TC161) TaxID=1328760 RepID=A0A165JV63_XYLHT|nr:hypothetical protein L228DRAFT_258070 [Xylona heveae TC161]KZF26672.1 hypothetical protein L228DRAFT_258070 [Xylona heveae TC161]
MAGSVGLENMLVQGDEDSQTHDQAEQSPSGQERSLDELLQQCRQVLREVDDFKTHLASCKKDKTVELRHFRNTISSELKLLEKLTKIDPATAELRSQHAVRSSNVPFYSAVWAAAKRSGSVVAFNKRFYWEEPPRRVPLQQCQPGSGANSPSTSSVDTPLNRAGPAAASSKRRKAHRPKRKSALVDVVARGGEEWIKVSTITSTRIGFEMAKVGWEADSQASSSNSEYSDDDDDDDDISLAKVTARLVRAAKSVRVRYRHPQVVLVLPKIYQHEHPAIDALLDDLRRTGTVVETGDTIPASPALSSSILRSLTIDPIRSFAPTVNVDCTLLLALVSDLSHGDVTPQPWFHTAIKRQIEREKSDTLLPSVLFPAMRGRKLVCVAQAAERMRDIVATIGTPTEKARTRVLLGDVDADAETDIFQLVGNHDNVKDSKHGSASITSSANLTALFQTLSSHSIPADLHLPISVVAQEEVDAAVEKTLPPTISSSLAQDLSDINTAVFMYGWAQGITTLSSNKTVAKHIQVAVEEDLDARDGEREAQDGEGGEGRGQGVVPAGPDIWLCPTARSLVGKEKNRRE